MAEIEKLDTSGNEGHGQTIGKIEKNFETLAQRVHDLARALMELFDHKDRHEAEVAAMRVRIADMGEDIAKATAPKAPTEAPPAPEAEEAKKTDEPGLGSNL